MSYLWLHVIFRIYYRLPTPQLSSISCPQSYFHSLAFGWFRFVLICSNIFWYFDPYQTPL